MTYPAADLHCGAARSGNTTNTTDTAQYGPRGMPCQPSHKGPLLTLIRHGETTANVARLLQGSTDSPLTVYGRSQVDALAASFYVASPTSDEQPRVLPRPSLIVSSPLGRTQTTARAILRASQNDREQGSQPEKESRSLEMILDQGLAERDFGPRENSRAGAGAGGPLQGGGGGRGGGGGESKAAFRARVERVGTRWLQASGLFPHHNNGIPQTSENENADAGPIANTKTESQSESESDPSGNRKRKRARSDSPSSPPSPSPSPAPSPSSETHVVLVTHGLWISTFLSLFLPHPSNQFVPFASNTGIFTLGLAPSLSSSSPIPTSLPASLQQPQLKPSPLILLRTNDTTHLRSVKRQKGGIGSTAHDEKQRKLDSFFKCSAG